MEAGNSKALVYKAKDDYFEVDLIKAYHLVVQIHENGLDVCVFDTESDKCLLFEAYRGEPWTENGGSLVSQLEELWNDHHCLNARFWKKVTVQVSNHMVTMVPEDFCVQGSERLYVKANIGLKDSSRVLRQDKEGLPSCIFTVDEGLAKWFEELYAENDLSFTHAGYSFLANCQKSFKNDTLYVQIQNGFFMVASWHYDKLRFFNSYSFSNSKEFLYYLLLVIDEVGLSTRHSGVIVWGDVDNSSPVVKKLMAYVKNYEYGDRPEGFFSGYQFDEVPENVGAEVFSAHLMF